MKPNRELEDLRQFAKSALTDPVTGVHNRRYLTQRHLEEAERCKRKGDPLALILLEIEQTRDTFSGDPDPDFTRMLARLMSSTARPYDVCAMATPGQLALLMPDADEEAARTVLSRIETRLRRSSLAQYPLRFRLGATHLAASHQSIESAIRSARETLDTLDTSPPAAPENTEPDFDLSQIDEPELSNWEERFDERVALTAPEASPEPPPVVQARAVAAPQPSPPADDFAEESLPPVKVSAPPTEDPTIDDFESDGFDPEHTDPVVHSGPPVESQSVMVAAPPVDGPTITD